MVYKAPSKLARRTYEALKLLSYTVLPEYSVGNRLRLDFLLKEISVGVECDGSQHSEFSAFFHDSKEAFKDQQKRDERKAELCAQHGIRLIRLTQDEILKSRGPEELCNIILDKITSTPESESEEEW